MRGYFISSHQGIIKQSDAKSTAPVLETDAAFAYPKPNIHFPF